MSDGGARKALAIVAGALLLSVAVFFASSKVSENSDTIARICESQNEQDAKQVQLWEFVITLSSGNRERTPEEQAQQDEQTKQFRKFLNETFAQEKCP